MSETYFNYSNILRNLPYSHSDNYNLDIKTSTIPGAGRGIFVKPGFTIHQGDIISEYRGYIVNTQQLDELGCHPTTEMIWDDDNIFTILGDNIAALVNDIIEFRPLNQVELETYRQTGRFPTHQGLSYNCAFRKIGGRIFLEATKDIPSGAELFTSYGENYWSFQFAHKGWI